MGLTQAELADELGTRQQTISEWETGLYQPRGLSERLLSLIAERAEFEYDAGVASQAGGHPRTPAKDVETGVEAGEALNPANEH
jgi:transcriptional regulator with XRE-family HTH domain